MISNSSKTTVHMVASLDGFVYKKDGNIDWLTSGDHYESGIALSKEDIKNYLAGIDCYVMGSKTYEQALVHGWPYGEKPVFVLSSRSLTSHYANVQFHNSELIEFFENKLRKEFKNIWIVGGPQLVKNCLQKKLVDEIIITIIPVLLGDGILFFDFIGIEQKLHLKNTVAYKDGLVELTYQIIK